MQKPMLTLSSSETGVATVDCAGVTAQPQCTQTTASSLISVPHLEQNIAKPP
jgi:hypothetical protein